MNLTRAQEQAVAAEGNVLVLAGAGTGKTRTMISRCLDRLFRSDNATQLDRILMVTFTEAAAAEMRQRIGTALQERQRAEPENRAIEEQIALLTSAKIGTLHSIALEIIREHAHELNLSRRLRVLSAEETIQLAEDALTTVLDHHYKNRRDGSAHICTQIREASPSGDRAIRRLVRRIHQYAQSLANPQAWLEEQLERNQHEQPTEWMRWLFEGLGPWSTEWLALLSDPADVCENIGSCRDTLHELNRSARFDNPTQPVHESITEQELETVLKQLHSMARADQNWPRGLKTQYRKPLESFFEDIDFLISLLANSTNDHHTALQEDWNRCRNWLQTLLQLTREFGSRFNELKAQLEGLDFSDLEQFALRLLYEPDRVNLSSTARQIQGRFDHVFVDEYQDINGAQDAIIRALSRPQETGNLFIVGDVKQSIYRFRLANPDILRGYEENWGGQTAPATRVYLQSNFRSHSRLLGLINDFCSSLAEQVTGFHYDESAHLIPGAVSEDIASPAPITTPIELHLVVSETQRKETHLPPNATLHCLAQRLRQLIDAGTRVDDTETGKSRPMVWSDIAILLRSVSDRPQEIARIFAHYGIPVQASAGQFFDFPEVYDLISLLKTIDNPLQDIPLLTLLRSPFFAFTNFELALVRLGRPKGPFWQAIQSFPDRATEVMEVIAQSESVPPAEASAAIQLVNNKCGRVQESLAHWLRQLRISTIATLIEDILATEYYVEYISSLHPSHQPEQHIRQLIQLARDYQRQPETSLGQFVLWLDR